MAKGTRGGRPGPDSLFKGKVIARRSALLTAAGNLRVDALRAKLAKELGRPKPVSFGDVVEALAHVFGDELTGEKVKAIAARINRQAELANTAA